MSGDSSLFHVHHPTIRKPGKRLVREVPLIFIKRKLTHSSRGGNTSLSLTSMIDFLLVVVIFLLSTFSTESEASIPKEVKLPNARNVQAMLAAPLVGVAGKDIYVDSKPAGNVNEAFEAMEQGRTAAPVRLTDLETKLKFMKETWKSINVDRPFPGTVVLQLDENLPAFVVKSVFYTCALSGYANISFLVNRQGKTSGGEAPHGE